MAQDTRQNLVEQQMFNGVGGKTWRWRTANIVTILRHIKISESGEMETISERMLSHGHPNRAVRHNMLLERLGWHSAGWLVSYDLKPMINALSIGGG